MSTPRDLYHDPANTRLKQLVAEYPKLAEFVRDAPVADPATLPPSAFADATNRLYPVHTEKMAALSVAYARYSLKVGERVPTLVVQALHDAEEAYGLSPDLFASATKVAAAPQHYVFPEREQYPIDTVEEVKLAEAALLDQAAKLLPPSRIAAFGALVKQANALGAELDPASLQYAGLTATDTALLRETLECRAAVTKDAGVKTAYLALADATKTTRGAKELADRGVRTKLAARIFELDTRAGLVNEYDRGIADPVKTVFNTTKVAGAGVELAGTYVPMTKLMSFEPSFYGDVLGEDFIPDLTSGGRLDRTKMAQVLATLPRDMAQKLAKMVRGTNR